MARPAGFEPTTPGLGILYSILLSYGRPGRLIPEISRPDNARATRSRDTLARENPPDAKAGATGARPASCRRNAALMLPNSNAIQN